MRQLIQYSAIILLLLTTNLTCAEEAGGMLAFPNLKSLKLEQIGVTLLYAAERSEVLTAPHPDAKDLNEGGIYVARPLRTRLLADSRTAFIIDCDSGGSADPSCTVFLESPNQLKKLINLPGLHFAFPGNGSIYVDGHSNTMFNMRRKFEWRDGTFVETPQPFRYVGLDTTTRSAVTLFAKTDYKQQVASLPAGSPVSVLLNEGEHYLIKTPFGLLGWIRIRDGQPPEASPINGIYYAGD